MDRMHADRLRHRQQHRHSDEDDLRRRQERAEDDVEENHQHDEHPPFGRDRRDRGRDHEREFRIGQHPAERADEADDQPDHAGEARGVRKDRRQLAQRGLAIEDRRHHERVDDRDRCGFGRREQAEQDAAHDDRRDRECRQRGGECGGELLHRRRRLLRVVALLRDHEHRHRHADAHQDARDHAGGEHRGDRLVRHPGVDHRDDRGRDDRRHHGGADGERGREVEVVALAHHLRDEERAERRDVGHRRARNAAEEHAVEHVDVGEPAAEAPDQHGRKIDQHARDPAARRDVAGEDEQRRGQQQVGVGEQPDEARRDDDRVERRIEHGGAERARAERDRDRHSGEDADDENDQERFGHRLPSAL